MDEIFPAAQTRPLTRASILATVGLAGALTALGGCPTRPPPVPAPPGPPGTVCEDACWKLTYLSCPGSEGSPGHDELPGNQDDVPCVQVCQDTLDQGTYRADRACLGRAATCSEVENCLLGE